MLKSEQLREFRPTFRYTNGAGITLAIIQDALKDVAQRNGIPLAFRQDQVKSGGLFNKTLEDCLVLYHPEHQKDYYNICIRIQMQGNTTFVVVNDFGSSKNEVKAGAAAGAIEGGNLGFVGSAIAKGLLGPKKNKVEAEQNYYACIVDILDEVIS